MKKYLLGGVILAILLIFSLPKGDNKTVSQEKPSPISFMENVFSVKTCNEFVMFFDGEAKAELEKENKDNFATTEECNENFIDHFNNNSIQCREVDKNVLNFDYINLGAQKNRPSYSDVVLCSKKSEKDVYFFLEYNKQEGVYKIKAIGGDIKEEVEVTKKEEEIELRKNPTNPAHRISPEAFIVDEENIISELPDDNKSVWVEMVIDENTIMVSYIILKGNENIITFATVHLYGLKDLGGCHKNEAVKFLKQFIEHKYVYLSGDCNIFPLEPEYAKFLGIPDKFLLKYVKILKEDVNISSVYDLHRDKKNDEKIEVNTTILYMGYGQPMVAGISIEKLCKNNAVELLFLPKKLKDIEEVAKVAKRGFWADDVCE